VRPALLLNSAGFDYGAGDPVGDLRDGVEAAGALGALIGRVAAERCGSRVAYVLEGGYDVTAVASSIALLAQAQDTPSSPGCAEPGAIPDPVRKTLGRLPGILQGSQPSASK
jgi:acetoin utilization deacetylase AcuC-like enzyme